MLRGTALLVIALTVLIPMPIAGGLPFLLGATALLVVLALRALTTHGYHIGISVAGVFGCALVLLGWETFTALFHYTQRDLELIAARGVWILLGFAYLSLLTGGGQERTVSNLGFVLFVGCTAMLIAMALESAFYPTFEVGRQLGALNIPWPRATGVPQSDGKIGVYLCLASVFFVVAFANTRRVFFLVGLLMAVAPLAFTQSRSTLLGLLLTLGFLFLYYLRTTSNIYLRIVATAVGALALWQFAAQFDQIYSTLVGEGVFARNVDARTEGNAHAINMIAMSPIVGPGAEYLLLEGMHKLEVHSTFFGLAVKSGMLGTALFALFIVCSAALASRRQAGLISNALMICALIAGPLSEHNLYPGYFNEHLWLIAPIALAVRFLEHGEPVPGPKRHSPGLLRFWRRKRARKKPVPPVRWPATGKPGAANPIP